MPPKRCSELPLEYSVYREKSVMNRERHLWYLSLTTPKCKSMTFCSFSFQASPWLVAPAPPSKATHVLCPPSKSYAKIYRQKRYALSTHLFCRKIMKDFQPSNALLQNALQHRCVITLDLLSQQFGVGHVEDGQQSSEIIFSEKHDLQKLSSLLCKGVISYHFPNTTQQNTMQYHTGHPTCSTCMIMKCCGIGTRPGSGIHVSTPNLRCCDGCHFLILTTPSTAFVCVWLRRSIFFYPSCIRESAAPMAGFWLLGQLQHAARRAGWNRTSRHEAIAKSQFTEHQLFLCLELWDV